MQTAPTRSAYSKYNPAGFAGEQRVKDFMRFNSQRIAQPTYVEDREQDIDLWVGRSRLQSYSIKTEHAGEPYRNVYFEIATQIPIWNMWQAEDLELASHWAGFDLKAEGYKPSWFFTGQAAKYAILQGDTLRIYDKKAVRSWLEANGPDSCKGLSYKLRTETQSGKNSRCIYCAWSKLPIEAKYILPTLRAA